MLTPQDLSIYIRDAGIAADLIHTAVDTPTVPAAAAALGVAPAQIVKSLLFLVRSQPVLVIASGGAMVDRHGLARYFEVGKKQIKLADAEAVLQITGYPVGGVPPFGYPEPVLALLDQAIRKWDVVYAGGGDDRTLLRITVDELSRVVRGEWLPLTEVAGFDPADARQAEI